MKNTAAKIMLRGKDIYLFLFCLKAVSEDIPAKKCCVNKVLKII